MTKRLLRNALGTDCDSASNHGDRGPLGASLEHRKVLEVNFQPSPGIEVGFWLSLRYPILLVLRHKTVITPLDQSFDQYYHPATSACAASPADTLSAKFRHVLIRGW